MKNNIGARVLALLDRPRRPMSKAEARQLGARDGAERANVLAVMSDGGYEFDDWREQAVEQSMARRSGVPDDLEEQYLDAFEETAREIAR